MIRRVVVAIPACNEQDGIAACLRSVQRACAAVDDDVTSEVVVALDSCTDATAAVVAGFPTVGTVEVDVRCVGLARRYAAQDALARGPIPSEEVWLASTDADCTVPADWLVRMLAHADSGADLVLGTVHPSDGLQLDVHAAWLDLHEVRDGHPHVHGANLGIRACAYLALGGWPALALHEDAELVARAVAGGRWRVHRSGDVPVVTSSRLSSRVENGFAGYLRALGASAPGISDAPHVGDTASVDELSPLLPRRSG